MYSASQCTGLWILPVELPALRPVDFDLSSPPQECRAARILVERVSAGDERTGDASRSLGSCTRRETLNITLSLEGKGKHVSNCS